MAALPSAETRLQQRRRGDHPGEAGISTCPDNRSRLPRHRGEWPFSLSHHGGGGDAPRPERPANADRSGCTEMDAGVPLSDRCPHVALPGAASHGAYAGPNAASRSPGSWTASERCCKVIVLVVYHTNRPRLRATVVDYLYSF